MKRITLVFAMLLFVGITAQMGFAQTEKEKNRDVMVKLTKLLEEKPFDAKAKDYRAGAFGYIAKTKDVAVVVCGGDFTKPLLNKKKIWCRTIKSIYNGDGCFQIIKPRQS